MTQYCSKTRKIHTYGTAAVLFAASLLVPSTSVGYDEVARTAGGVPYVSGGIGADSITRLETLSRDFNLKLVFALKSGEYLSGVSVAVADTAGKIVLETTAEGPWLLTRLPTGTYRIAVRYGDRTERRTVSIGPARLSTVDFRWASE